MNVLSAFYASQQIPAIDDPYIKSLCQGDIAGAVRQEFTRISRVASSLPPDSCSLSLGFVFTPSGRADLAQSRLRLFLAVSAYKQEFLNALRTLLDTGTLRTLYARDSRNKGLDAWLIPQAPPIPWDMFTVSCDVIRDVHAVRPVLSPGDNKDVPDTLRKDLPLSSNDENDYLDLDQALDHIDSHALIHICVKPADVSVERNAVAKYIAHLERLSHSHHGQEPPQFNVAFPDQDSTVRSVRPSSPPQTPEPLAYDIRRFAESRREELDEQQVLFHCRVFASDTGTARLLASVIAESAFAKGTYRFKFLQKSEQAYESAIWAARSGEVFVVPDPAEQVFKKDPQLYGDFSRLIQLARPADLSGLFRWPIGTLHSPRCIRQSTDPPEIEEASLVVFGHDAGLTSRVGTAPPRGPKTESLNKGCAVIGMSGTGKTTVLSHIAIQLHDKGIKFTFFSPIAGEQSSVLFYADHDGDPRVRGLARDLRIYTPGRDDVSPFTFNPLRRFPWVSLHTHIDGLMECFRGAVPLDGPLDALLREALYQVYRDYPDTPPRMSDLADAASRVFARKKYGTETKGDLEAAIDTRIRTLSTGLMGSIFEPGVNCPDIPELLSGYSLIELDALPEEEKAKFMLFMLKAIREYVAHVPVTQDDMLLQIIVDEAHLIAPSKSRHAQSPDSTDPSAYAANSVCRLLREFRKRKVGLLLADQSSANVSPDVVRMTATKLVMRTVDREDREAIGGAMLFGEYEFEHTARLDPGGAFFFGEGYHRPRLIQTVHLQDKLPRLSVTPQYEQIREAISQRDWFKSHWVASTRARLEWVQRELKALDTMRQKLATHVDEMKKQQQEKTVKPATVDQWVNIEQQRLLDSIARFYFEIYRPALALCRGDDPQELGNLREKLTQEFEKRYGDVVSKLEHESK